MTGNVNVPKITAPTTQIYQPQAQPYQRDSYNYTPRQFSATPSSGPVSVARPMGYQGGPVLMDKPIQGYQAPMRTVDYSYRPQYTPGRTIESPRWAVPVYTAPYGAERLFGGLQQPTFDENGNMITAMEANAQEG